MQCKTTCKFKKKASHEGIAGESSIQNDRESELVKAGAIAVARKQQQLQHLRSMIRTLPDDANLATHEARLQLEISQMLQQLLERGRC